MEHAPVQVQLSCRQRVSVRGGPWRAAAGQSDTGEGLLGVELGVDLNGTFQSRKGRSRSRESREPAPHFDPHGSPGPGVFVPQRPELRGKGRRDGHGESEQSVGTPQ